MVGIAGSPADAAKIKLKAAMTGTADAAGNVDVSANTSALTVHALGQLALGTGTGNKAAAGTGTTNATGGFSGVATSSKMTLDVTGQLGGGGPFPPGGTAIAITIKCTVSYPPLSIRCTITIST